jgi:FkbM family methyltransferase
LSIRTFIKKIAKELQASLPYAIGKNEVYDRFTKEIITTLCKKESICIDIGANEGKILDWIIEAAPLSKHYAFEPIPKLYSQLLSKYSAHASILPIALSNHKGTSKFNFVTTNAALSGLKKRPYASFHQEETIEVSIDLLDNIINEDEKICLIKIDVEGGEWHVLEGASKTILRSNPIILFECGKIGGELYGFSAADIYQHFHQFYDYQIYTLKGWLKTKTDLSFSAFEKYFENGKEYFFLAAPKNIHKNS